MLLIGVKEENGWISSRWQLTYRASWDMICKSVYSMFDFYSDKEILVDGKPVDMPEKNAVLRLEEHGEIIFRGFSEIINAPLMISFYNQVNAVDVCIPPSAQEFQGADYKQFNLLLGQYMDSIELAMYR